MESYLALIDRLGQRSTGDNLVGFRYDLDHFLFRTACFTEVKTRIIEADAIDATGVMLVTRAPARARVKRAEVQLAVQAAWITSLVYRGNERHRFEEVGGALHFHFATWTEKLGVVGRVECGFPGG